MASTVSFKPNAAQSGESNWTKTGGATCHAVLSDNSDASYIVRVSSGATATAIVKLDTTVIPAGKNLNRWKIRVRQSRPLDTSKLSGVLYVYSTTGAYSIIKSATWVGGSGLQWEESGYYPGTVDPLAVPGLTTSAVLIGVSDQAATAGARSTVYESWIELDYLNPPTATVSAPSGTITDTTFPTITWAFTSTESNPQDAAVVKVFDAATYGAAGFDAATSTPTWETTVTGSALSVAVDGALTNGTTYRAYVLVSEGTGYISSKAVSYAFSTFTLTLTPPASPTVAAGYAQVTNSTSVNVQGHTNTLTADQSSLEVAVTGWVTAGTNCTASRSTTVGGKVGSAALRLSSTAGGDMSTTTTVGTGGIPVLTGETYTALASARTGVTVRTCRVDIVWYDSGGSVLSTTTGTSLADAVGSWTTDIATIAVAPTSAAFAAVKVVVLATGGASELHYFDTIALYPGIASSSVNLCNNPSFEVDTSGWSGAPLGYTVATIATSATFSVHGTKSCLVTWPTVGVSGSAIQYAAIGLTIGQRYAFSGSVRVPTGSPKVNIGDLFGTSGSPIYGTRDTGATFNAFVRLDVAFTATATTHYLGFTNAAAATAGNTCYVDAVQLEAAVAPTAFSVPTATWTQGGFGTGAVILERSNDGGAVWLTVRRATVDVITNGGVTVDARTQRYSVTDFEAARPGDVLYRARYVAVLASAVVNSDWTANYILTTSSDGLAWLKAVDASGLNLSVALRRGSLGVQIDEDTGIFRPLGRAGEGIVISGDLYGHDGALTVLARTALEYEGALSLLTHQGTLLLQEPLIDSSGRGLQRWIRSTGLRTVTVADNPTYRDLAVSFVDVGAT